MEDRGPSTGSASCLLNPDNEDGGSTGDDVARSADDSFQSFGDDLRPLQDDDDEDDSSSTSTNETAFSDDVPAASLLQNPQTGYLPQSSLESGHI